MSKDIYCDGCQNPKIQCLCNEDKPISAFAYNMGREVERIINEHTNNLENDNIMLQAKIMQWYADNGKDAKFAKFFGIESQRKGES
jgi:hypothetical protein